MTASTGTVEFMETVAHALDPNLSMYLLRENERFAVFAGLWGSWWLDDTRRRAKVVLVTVLKDTGSPAPKGPVTLGRLVPWLVMRPDVAPHHRVRRQLHVVDEENPIWESLHQTLLTEFENTPNSKTTHPPSGSLVFDPSQDNHHGRAMVQPEVLSHMGLTQSPVAGRDVQDGVPRPRRLINRRRVEATRSGPPPEAPGRACIHAGWPVRSGGPGVRGETHNKATRAAADGGRRRTGPRTVPWSPLPVGPAPTAASWAPSTSGTRGSWPTIGQAKDRRMEPPGQRGRQANLHPDVHRNQTPTRPPVLQTEATANTRP